MTRKAGIFGVLAIVITFVILHLGFADVEAGSRAVNATLIGGIAYLLMAIAIFLATRPRFLESSFGGLDRMYKVHKMCGVFAGLLVLLHFFSAPKGIPPIFADRGIEMAPSAPLGMLSMIALIISLAITLNRKIAYHRWRMPHKAMGIIFIMITGHFITAPEIFFDRFSPSGVMLVVAAVVGILSYFYSLFGMNKRTGKSFTIEAVNHLERATEIVLKPVADNLSFKPGQFAFIELQGKGWNEPHPFTISSSPEDDRLRFTMKVLGDWTRKIREELKPGGEAIVRGPYGCFDSEKAGNKQVWLAGGIGVTPFLSMIRAMKVDDLREITLVYAVREKKEAVFLDELEEKAATLKNVKIVVLESNKKHFARVDIMKTKLDSALPDYDFFLCGPPPMIKGLSKDLGKEGVPRDRIHTEAFEFR